jgi:predicted ATPase/class 3 adenylate cyclase
MNSLPTGTVTLLLTDVEGSTIRWERDESLMREAMARHDAEAKRIAESHQGHLVKSRGEGDSLFIAFARPGDAVRAAIELQRALSTIDVGGYGLKVRIALHTGELGVRDNDYYGPPVNRCGRLRGVAHGGQILVSQTTFQLVRDQLPSGVQARDLGWHRLRDLLRPERVWQLDADGLPQDFPRLRSMDVQPNNLPVQVTRFIGRETDVGQLASYLATTRLVTVCGPGGLGKTRLALQVAAEEMERFPDGIWFVDLAAVQKEEEVAAAVMRGIGWSNSGAAREQDLFHAMQDRTLLLVLDNCEHVIGAARTLVGESLTAAPNLSVLATSREPLRVAGERVFRIPPLSAPPNSDDLSLDQALTFDAVRLFCDRASHTDSRFALTTQNLPSVAAICRRLEGLPLAIVQASSHVDYLSPAEIAQDLMEFLRTPAQSVGDDERHRTQWDTIRWSYNTLAEAERNVFDGLWVFRGGFNRRCFEALIPSLGAMAPGSARLLERLVQKSLVQSEPIADGTMRYRLLEPIREFALENAADREAVHAAHAQIFARMGIELGLKVETNEQESALFSLDYDIDNVLVALENLIDREGVLATRVTYALRNYWLRRGRISEARAWHERCRPWSNQLPLQERVQFLNSCGALAWKAGDREQTRVDLEAGLALLTDSVEFSSLRARTVNNLALLAIEENRYEDGRDRFRESLAAFRQTDEINHVGTVLSNLGSIETTLGDYAAAREHLVEAIAISRSLGNGGKTARAFSNLAEVEFAQGQTGKAAECLLSAFEIWRTLVDLPFIGEGLLTLAAVLERGERPLEAARALGCSDALLQECGTQLSLPQADHRNAIRAELTEQLTAETFDLMMEEGAQMDATAGVDYGSEVCRELAKRPTST